MTDSRDLLTLQACQASSDDPPRASNTHSNHSLCSLLSRPLSVRMIQAKTFLMPSMTLSPAKTVHLAAAVQPCRPTSNLLPTLWLHTRKDHTSCGNSHRVDRPLSPIGEKRNSGEPQLTSRLVQAPETNQVPRCGKVRKSPRQTLFQVRIQRPAPTPNFSSMPRP